MELVWNVDGAYLSCIGQRPNQSTMRPTRSHLLYVWKGMPTKRANGESASDIGGGPHPLGFSWITGNTKFGASDMVQMSVDLVLGCFGCAKFLKVGGLEWWRGGARIWIKITNNMTTFINKIQKIESFIQALIPHLSKKHQLNIYLQTSYQKLGHLFRPLFHVSPKTTLVVSPYPHSPSSQKHQKTARLSTTDSSTSKE